MKTGIIELAGRPTYGVLDLTCLVILGKYLGEILVGWGQVWLEAR